MPGNLHTLPSSRNLTLILPISIFPSYIITSLYTLKSHRDMIQDDLTPLSILKQSLSPPFILTQARLLTFILFILLYLRHAFSDHGASIITIIRLLQFHKTYSHLIFLFLCFLYYLSRSGDYASSCPISYPSI